MLNTIPEEADLAILTGTTWPDAFLICKANKLADGLNSSEFMYTEIPFLIVKVPSAGFSDLGKGIMLYAFWAKELHAINMNKIKTWIFFIIQFGLSCKDIGSNLKLVEYIIINFKRKMLNLAPN